MRAEGKGDYRRRRQAHAEEGCGGGETPLEKKEGGEGGRGEEHQHDVEREDECEGGEVHASVEGGCGGGCGGWLGADNTNYLGRAAEVPFI